jgi:hypothetical protein
MQMTRLRSHSNFGSWLALFALAFQLVVSFGHVHLDRALPGSQPPSASSVAQTTTDANTASPRHGDKSPALADDYCALCALIHLAGTVVASTPPELPLPVMFDALLSQARVDFGAPAPNSAAFAARAPPLA